MATLDLKSPSGRWHALAVEYQKMAKPNHSEAMRQTGLNRKTVIKYYNEGVPKENLPPIKDYLEQLKLKAMAKKAEARREQEELQLSVRDQMTRIAEIEEGMTEGVRSIAGHLLTGAFQLVGASQPVVEKLIKQVREAGEDADPTTGNPMTSGRRFKVLRLVNEYVKNSVHATEAALRLERLRRNEPEKTIGVAVGKAGPPAGSPEDLRKEALAGLGDMFKAVGVGVTINIEPEETDDRDDDEGRAGSDPGGDAGQGE